MNFIINLKEKKINFFKKSNVFYFFFIIITFLLDRTTKLIIINNFSEQAYYVNKFINLDLIWNNGIGFGLLSFNNPLFYNSITFLIGIIIIFLIYVSFTSLYQDRLACSIIIGGAIGNIYDRLTYKAVPDFIDIHYENFHWFVFNVADIFITLGTIILLINGYFKKN